MKQATLPNLFSRTGGIAAAPAMPAWNEQLHGVERRPKFERMENPDSNGWMKMNQDAERTPAQGEIELRIVKATERAGKSYSFDETHDEKLPIDFWFQESDEGLILFVVFYGQACRWSLCTGCNLPSLSATHHVGYRALIEQIDHVFNEPEVGARKNDLRKIIVSNNGSVLDEETFPSTALMHLVAQINLLFPNLRVVSLETRVEYVDIAELEFLSRAMKERDKPATIELAIGFEAFDDHIRNNVFLKGLTLRAFEGLVSRVAKPHLRLKCYFMQKPVAEMTDDEAVGDVQSGIEYLNGVMEASGVAIAMHLNPTYVARGTALESAFRDKRYTPPRLRDVVRAVLHGKDRSISIFVGLNDEGLAVKGGSFIRPGDQALIGCLESFNRTQDYDTLAACLTASNV